MQRRPMKRYSSPIRLPQKQVDQVAVDTAIAL